MYCQLYCQVSGHYEEALPRVLENFMDSSPRSLTELVLTNFELSHAMVSMLNWSLVHFYGCGRATNPGLGSSDVVRQLKQHMVQHMMYRCDLVTLKF